MICARTSRALHRAWFTRSRHAARFATSVMVSTSSVHDAWLSHTFRSLPARTWRSCVVSACPRLLTQMAWRFAVSCMTRLAVVRRATDASIAVRTPPTGQLLPPRCLHPKVGMRNTRHTLSCATESLCARRSQLKFLSIVPARATRGAKRVSQFFSNYFCVSGTNSRSCEH